MVKCITPTKKDLSAVLAETKALIAANPAEYYDSDCDDSDLLGKAQKELYGRMKDAFVDAWMDDEALFDELTDDLPDGRESYSDYDLENYVGDMAEENFAEEYGPDPIDLEPKDYWDELVKIEPELIYYCVITVTVGSDGKSRKFGYQFGDNSYTGGAYGYPYWAVETVSIDTKPDVFARSVAYGISQSCRDAQPAVRTSPTRRSR